MIQSTDKKIWLPDGDTWYKWSDSWELDEYNEVMQHISEKNVAIDIGAHVGIWSMRLAEQFKKVYAFEPVPKHIECWKQNMLRYTDSRNYPEKTITLETVALSNIEGTNKLNVCTINSGMSTFTPKEYTNVGEWSKVEVKTKPLDSYDFDKIDFIKIDVEDHEYKLLLGAKETIKKHKPVLYIEITDHEAIRFLESLKLGYKLIYGTSMNRLYKSNTVVEDLQELLKTQK